MPDFIYVWNIEQAAVTECQRTCKAKIYNNQSGNNSENILFDHNFRFGANVVI